MRRIAPAVAAAVVALLAGGCVPSFSLKTGQPIGDNQVRAITPGTTTKSELFRWFGAPAAIAARGEVLAIATPATWATSHGNESSYGLDADTFYELFQEARAPDEYRRIYYFHHVVGDKMNYFMLLALYEHGGMKWDRLWALVNEKTGIVEDYAYKGSGANTVFGAPRPSAAR